MNNRNARRALSLGLAALATLTILGSIQLLAEPAHDPAAIASAAPADQVVVIEARRRPKT